MAHGPQFKNRKQPAVPSRPNLPKDLRQKILQTRDDLERTVRIRAAFVPST